MADEAARRGLPLRALAGRTLGYFTLWIVLGPRGPADLAVGLAAALAAAALSLWLLPTGENRVSFPGAVRFAARFLRQSAVSGIEVARRVFSRDMALQPGVISADTRMTPGLARDTFRAVASLQPGTLPLPAQAGEEQAGRLLVHTLDTRAEIAEMLATDEAALRHVLKGPKGQLAKGQSGHG